MKLRLPLQCRFSLSSWAALGLVCLTTACGGSREPAKSSDRALSPAEPLAGGQRSPAALASHFAGVMPRGLTTMGAVVHGDALYLSGGYFGSPHEYSKEFQSGSFTRLKLDGGEWEELPGITPIQSPALISDDRYIYQIGGMRAFNAASEPTQMRSVAEVARFDPARNVWESLPSLPEPRSSHQAIIADGVLYVVGGWALAGGMYDSTWSETLLTADLSQPELTWESHPMPFNIRAHGLAAHRGKLYVLGGLDPEGGTDRVRRYDLATRTWSDGPTLPPKNMTTRAAVFQGQLYANGADGNVYRLSADETAWEPAGSAQFPRLFHEMVSSERGPLLIGGVPNNGRGARVRVIEQLSPEAPPAGVVLNLEGKSAAKNRQAALLWSQQLFVFGGNNSLEQHDFAPQNFVNEGWRLDLGALEWREVPDFPKARQSMQALLTGKDGSRALVLGGFGFEGERLTSHDDVFSYDIMKREWSALDTAKLPAAMTQFGVAEWDDAVWVFGGMSFDGSREGPEQMRHMTRVLRLDLSADEPRFADAEIELGEPRRAFAGALLADTYYLTGGLKENFEPAASCEAVDLKAQQVSPLPCPSMHRLGGELVALGGKLYLVGGSAKAGDAERRPSAQIEVFDPAKGAWSTLPSPLPLDSAAHVRAFAFEDQLLLYSAQRSDGLVQIAFLDPAALAAGRQDYVRARVPPPPPMP